MTNSRALCCVFVLAIIFLNVHAIHGYYYDKGNQRISFERFFSNFSKLNFYKAQYRP
jgi:uncharacterized membrane protein